MALEDSGINVRIILKETLKMMAGMERTGFIWIRESTSQRVFWYGNERLGCVKCSEI
jgi:hypothetical protein